jgi:hypothetical protein
MSRPLPTSCFDFKGVNELFARSKDLRWQAVQREPSREITRADVSMTTFVDTHCISVKYTDYSLQRPLALNFQFPPNFSIKIGLEAPGSLRKAFVFGGVL